jgi:hypothetical protein
MERGRDESPTMRLAQGDNHTISVKEGIVTCEVISRPDLSAEAGAKSAVQLVDFLTRNVLHATSPYRGLTFDVRRGPPVFGPKTRETLSGLFALAGRAGKPIAVLVGDSPIQLLQFRNLCRDSAGRAEVFHDEASALRWYDEPGVARGA